MIWVLSLAIEQAWVVMEVANDWYVCAVVQDSSLALLTVKDFNSGAELDWITAPHLFWDFLFGEFDYFFDIDGYGVQVPFFWIGVAILLTAFLMVFFGRRAKS